MHLIRFLLVPVVVALMTGFLLTAVFGLLTFAGAQNILQQGAAINLLSMSMTSLAGAGTAIGLLAVAQALESRNKQAQAPPAAAPPMSQQYPVQGAPQSQRW